MMDKQIKEKVEIYSVSPLEKEAINLLFDKFPFLKNSKIVFKINKQLMAGILIKRKGQIIDLSLRNRLIDLKKLTYETII